jgi:hypothetical protein
MDLGNLIQLVKYHKVTEQQEEQMQDFFLHVDSEYKQDRKTHKITFSKKTKNWSASIIALLPSN